MERIFQVLAVVLAAAAVYFFWVGNNDGAFLAGVFGSVAFFLSIRAQVKKRNRDREVAAKPTSEV
ncbi:MAG: MnhB domain-containing protein [Acidobacteriota bacterium]